MCVALARVQGRSGECLNVYRLCGSAKLRHQHGMGACVWGVTAQGDHSWRRGAMASLLLRVTSVVVRDRLPGRGEGEGAGVIVEAGGEADAGGLSFLFRERTRTDDGGVAGVVGERQVVGREVGVAEDIDSREDSLKVV